MIKRHFTSSLNAWSTILKHPLEHLINILVLALIIILCAFSMALNNSLKIWQQKNVVYPQALLYFESSATIRDINKVEQVLNKMIPITIRNYQYISKDQGLQELNNDSSFKAEAGTLIDTSNNPLPEMIVINTNSAESMPLQHLHLVLEQMPHIAEVLIDMNYAAKISALLAFLNQLGLFSCILFIIVLSLVVYNMIRLQMLLKSDAILVTRLIGANDSFVMRPLIHYALWQITLACGTAILSLNYLITNLNALFQEFSNLLGKGFVISQLSLPQCASLWIILLIFSTFTVFLAVRWVFSRNQAI